MKRDPAALRQVAAQLQVGVVLNLYSPIACKDKFHILIYAGNDRSIAFLINTTPAAFILKDPQRAARHIVIKRDLHPFLDYDSYIACDETVGISCGPDCRIATMQELIEAVSCGEVKIIGSLHRSMFTAATAAANGSRTISARDAAKITAAFANS
jgi:hypothetical protein